jgi:hypothetical protein
MHPVIQFKSSRFDVSSEPENPINPIRGVSLLRWLFERVPKDLEVSEPDAEDWGWYSYVTWEGRQYLVGACVHENQDGNHDWVLQVDKTRSVIERLLGRARLTADDYVFSLIMGLISNEPAFTEVSVQSGS